MHISNVGLSVDVQSNGQNFTHPNSTAGAPPVTSTIVPLETVKRGDLGKAYVEIRATGGPALAGDLVVANGSDFCQRAGYVAPEPGVLGTPTYGYDCSGLPMGTTAVTFTGSKGGELGRVLGGGMGGGC